MQIKSPNAAGAVAPAGGAAGKAGDDVRLRAACKDLEAVFLNMLLTQMRRTVPQNGLVPRSSQQDIMQSMLDGEMTKGMAQAGGIGLAGMLYRQLSPTVRTTSNKGQAPE